MKLLLPWHQNMKCFKNFHIIFVQSPCSCLYCSSFCICNDKWAPKFFLLGGYFALNSFCPSLLCSLHDRLINLGDSGLRQPELALFGKPADWDDGRLKITIVLGPGCQVLLRIEDGERNGNKIKRPLILADISQSSRFRINPCRLHN